SGGEAISAPRPRPPFGCRGDVCRSEACCPPLLAGTLVLGRAGICPLVEDSDMNCVNHEKRDNCTLPRRDLFVKSITGRAWVCEEYRCPSATMQYNDVSPATASL